MSNAIRIIKDYFSLVDYETFCIHNLGFKPYPEQLTISRSFDKYSYLVVLMSRQAGKTHTIGSKALHYALTNPNQRILIFTPSKQQAVDVLFGRIKAWLEQSEFLSSFIRENSQAQPMLYSDHVDFKNGTSIRCLSASDRSNIVGFTGNVVILDECQDISDLVVYQRIEPMLGSIKDPKYIKIGTPRGIKSQFFESWRMGKENKIWHVEEYPWQQCSNLNKDIIENYRRSNPHFATEYELKWMNNIESFFSKAELEDLFQDYDLEIYMKKFEEGRGSNIYKEVYCGIDWAKIKDDTVVSFVANEGGKFVLVGAYELSGDYREQIREIYRLLAIYNPLVTYMDATGSTSQALSDMLQGKGHYIEPIIMTNKFKATILYDNMKRIINYRLLELPKDNDKMQIQFYDLQITRTQGTNFFDRIAHPDNGHDDYPDSISLCCLGFKELVDTKTENLAYEDSDSIRSWIDEELVVGINQSPSRGSDKAPTTAKDHGRSGFIDLVDL